MGKTFFLAVFLALAVPASYASELSGVSVSNSGADAFSDVLKHLQVSTFSTFHGTPLNDVTSPYTLDHNGKNTKIPFNTINFDSSITAAYMLTSDIGIGPDVPFLLVPVQGQGLILGAVGLKTFNKHLISSNGFNLAANLYLQTPTSKADRARGFNFGLKTTPAIRYIIPSSRFTVGSWTEAKWYAGVTSGKTFKLWALPYVNYALSNSFSLNLGYAMESLHLKDKPAFDFTTYQTDLEPGFVWMVTPKVMVNPYLQIFTGNKVSSETTAFGAVMSATLL